MTLHTSSLGIRHSSLRLSGGSGQVAQGCDDLQDEREPVDEVRGFRGFGAGGLGWGDEARGLLAVAQTIEIADYGQHDVEHAGIVEDGADAVGPGAVNAGELGELQQELERCAEPSWRVQRFANGAQRVEQTEQLAKFAVDAEEGGG